MQSIKQKSKYNYTYSNMNNGKIVLIFVRRIYFLTSETCKLSERYQIDRGILECD